MQEFEHRGQGEGYYIAVVEVVIFSVEKKKCKHIANSVEWVVESTTSYRVIP